MSLPDALESLGYDPEAAEDLAEEIHEAVWGVLHGPIWGAVFATRGKIKWGPKDEHQDTTYSDEDPEHCWASVEYPTSAVITKRVRYSWRAPFEQALPPAARGVVHEAVVEAALQPLVEETVADALDDVADEYGDREVQLRDRLEERAWQKQIEVESVWYDEEGEETDFGCDPDVRLDFDARPHEISDLHIAAEELTFTVRFPFRIGFWVMYFPGDYDYQRW